VYRTPASSKCSTTVFHAIDGVSCMVTGDGVAVGLPDPIDPGLRAVALVKGPGHPGPIAGSDGGDLVIDRGLQGGRTRERLR
jgi:hypothetical protein